MSELPTIENPVEAQAELAAWMSAPDEAVDNACEEERNTFRAGWIAGRDWARREAFERDRPTRERY